MADVTEPRKRNPFASALTKIVVALPIVVAVIALAMSSAFAEEMMTEEEMDMGGAVEAKWDYVDEENSVDMPANP